ncbi:histidine kinase, partial [filamentous cyanobacterium Phorm 46]
VLGFGGLLRSGSLFAVVISLKVKIPQSTAQMFKYLALSVKTSLSLSDEKVVFNSSDNAKNIVKNNNIYETQMLEHQVTDLIQLLDFSEQEMLRQAANFQRTIDKLQRELAGRKKKQQILQPSQEPFTGILNIGEDEMLRFEENPGI